MSTWISEARGAILRAGTLALLLAGCFEAAPLQGFSARDAVPGPPAVTVAGGEVTVAGPDGYCVDTSSTVDGDREAFVLLVRCRVDERHRPVLGATVTALPAESADTAADLDALLAAVTSDASRGHLSRSGRAGDVRIDAARVEDGAVWLRIHDAGSPEAFAPGYWRAILPAGDRVVTLSVLEIRATAGARDGGLAILQRFVARMRSANPT